MPAGIAGRHSRKTLSQGNSRESGFSYDRAAIAKIENNLRHLLDYELKAFADVLGVDANWLLGDRKR